jgi:ribonucleoside-diphosphate reductase beta chain
MLDLLCSPEAPHAEPKNVLATSECLAFYGVPEFCDSYKPFRIRPTYPWAYDAKPIWKAPAADPLDARRSAAGRGREGLGAEDQAERCRERNLLTQIFRFFTQADVEVNNCYMKSYGRVFKPTESEDDAGRLLQHGDGAHRRLRTAARHHRHARERVLRLPQYKEMKDKHDYMQKFGVETRRDIARTLAMFGAFTEGLQLFASFAMLMNFPRFNKMKGMGQIVTWSVRDESAALRRHHPPVPHLREGDGRLTKAVKEDIIDCCQNRRRLEDAFIDLAFEMGPVQGMTAKDIKNYIRYIADWRLGQLKLAGHLWHERAPPLPWLSELLNGVEHANFFETRATEYSKAATRGNWNEVWDSFDRRKRKVANEDVSTDDGEDMFARAGVAAE